MRLVIVLSALFLAGCDRLQPSRSSVTVTLPPPQPAEPQPGFSAAAAPASR